MTDAEFWEIVESIGWSTRDQDWSDLRMKLVAGLTSVQAEGVWWIFRHKVRELDRVVNEWEATHDTKFPLDGEDRVDLLAHVVGLGRAEFQASCLVPDTLVSRARRSDFQPGLLAAIPSASDYHPKP
jgi:hypothetical protein